MNNNKRLEDVKMNSKTFILPTSNRTLLRSISQSLTGTIAYGSRAHIYFIDLKTVPPSLVDPKFLHSAHKGTVRTLSFCNYDGPEILASWGEDSLLKIWDLETLSCSYRSEVKDLRSLEWVYGNSDLLAYVAEGRHFIKYNLKLDKHERVRLKSEIPIHILLSNKLNPELMAAGLSDGTIMIINIVHERIEIKLKAHSADITDLAWSPHSDISLLSCSQDQTLRVWKINEDAPVFTYYSTAKKIKYDDKKFAKTLGFFHPDEENTIVYLNARNEVGEISTDDPQNPKFHSYFIKNIDMYSKFPSALILSSCKEYIYYFDTFKISKYSLKRKESITQFPFMYGIAYDLAISKLSASMLAIASGDGILRIVNTGSDPEKLNLTSIYIQSKVRIMTVAWHPSLDYIIAYGTDQGRVGIADIYKKKSMYSFETHHIGTVYSLVWGTCSKAEQKDGAVDDLFLYSCGSGRIYINKRGFPKDKALNFDDLIEKPIEYKDSNNSYSEMRWNSDYTTLCIGSLKGFIEIYDGSLNFLGRLIIPMKNLESVYWHPETTYMSPAGSPLKSWIACVGNDNDIYIFDTAPVSSATEPDVHMYRPVKQLIGHNRRVVKISWSYHEDGFLVSAAKDGCAMVWNVLTQTCIATYLHHVDIVYSVQWSLTDKDVIYSGGGDFSVRQWKISEQTVQPAPNNAPKLRKLKKFKKVFHEVCCEPIDSSNNISIAAEPRIDSNNGSSDTIDQSKTNHFKRPLKKKGVPIRKTLVYTPTLNASNTITEGDLENCSKLANFLSGKQKKNFDSYLSSLESLKHNLLSDEDILKIGVFTDQLTVLRMIDLQSSVYLSKNDNDSAFELSLLGGNVQQVLKEAAESKTLSPFLVSMAPSVSCNFWLEICEKYAAQLIDQQQYYRAATYYLICGKVYEAVNLIAERGNLLDAIAVAKARLPENDPFLPKLFYTLRKKYDQALYPAGVVQCSLALNNPSSAAKVLASLKIPNAVRAAVHICRQFDLDKEANEYLFQLLETSLSQCDWTAFEKASIEEPFLQEYDALVSVHKALNIQIQYLKPRDGLLFQGIFNSEKFAPKIKFYSGVTDKESNLPFIDILKNQLLSKHVSADEDIFKILNTLKLLEDRRKSLEISSEAHVLVAMLLTQYVLLLHSKDANSGQILLNTFDATYNVVFLPRIISMLLFPFDLYWDEESKTFTYDMLINWENKEDNLLEYRNFCKDIAETFVNFKAKSFEVPSIAKDLEEDLSVKVSNTKNILFSKSTKDFLLLYFIASNVNDLQRVVKKKDFQLKCSIHDQNISDKNTIKVRGTANDELLISNELPNKIISEHKENTNKILTNKEIVENASKSDSDIKVVDVSSHEAERVFNDLDSQKVVENDCEKKPCNKEVDSDSKNVPCDDDETSSHKDNEFNSTNKADDISNDSESVIKNNSSDITDKKSFENNGICELMNIGATLSFDENNQIHDEENLIKNDNMLVLQNLIQSVIEEADNKAKSILEAKEKADNIDTNGINLIEQDQILSGINEVPSQSMKENEKSYLEVKINSVIKVSHDCSENNFFNCDETSHSTTKNSECSLFNTEIDETLHESCLKRIDLLYNIMLFFASHICRDEYAFLYHIKEKLKLLNNEMAANVLNEISSKKLPQTEKDKKRKIKTKNLQQTSQIKDANYDQNDLDNHKNDSIQIVENISTEKTVEKLSTEYNKLSEGKAEVKFQNNGAELSESCESLIDDEVTHDLISKKCNLELLENEISNENSCYREPNETGSMDSSKNETVLPEINSSNEDGNQTVIIQNHEQSTKNCETSESETFNKHEIVDQTYKNKFSNASSNESEEKTKELSLTFSAYQNLTKKHEVLIDALSRLQEGSNCTYPNPFEITSKLCETTTDLIMVSNCYAVKNKLHSFLHSVINWTEKFGIGEINYMCQVCTSNH